MDTSAKEKSDEEIIGKGNICKRTTPERKHLKKDNSRKENLKRTILKRKHLKMMIPERTNLKKDNSEKEQSGKG